MDTPILTDIKYLAGDVMVTLKIDLDPDGKEYYDKAVRIRTLSFKAYLENYGYNIIGLSVGYHYEGKNERPHAHSHFICRPSTGSALLRISASNESRDRKAWVAKEYKKNEKVYCLDDISVKYTVVDPESFHAEMLSYPLKEGHRHPNPEFYIYQNGQMSEDMVVALQRYGQNLYAATKAESERKAAAAEKSRSVREKILMIAELHKHKFRTYRDMVLLLDEKYIGNLEFSEYPRPNDYKVHCQQVAIKLGVMKFSDLC